MRGHSIMFLHAQGWFLPAKHTLGMNRALLLSTVTAANLAQQQTAQQLITSRCCPGAQALSRMNQPAAALLLRKILRKVLGRSMLFHTYAWHDHTTFVQQHCHIIAIPYGFYNF